MLLDTRPVGASRTGIGRYAQLLASLTDGPVGVHEVIDGRRLLDFESEADEELGLPALLSREGIDVYHSPIFRLPTVLPVSAVVTIHDAIPATHPALTTASFRALWSEAGQAASRADAVVCPTEAAKRDVVEALGLEPGRVQVVPEAPSATFRPTSSEEQAQALASAGLGPGPFVLVLGALDRRKDPLVVLDALALDPRLPRAVFVGPPGEIDVRAEAVARGLDQRVLLLGLLPDELLVPLLGAAQALVFPTRAEGFGLPVIEAFMTNTPVVASDLPAIREVAGEAAAFMIPGDPKSLVEAARRAMASKAALVAEGRARLERFSMTRVREGFARLYDALEVVRA